MDGDVAFEDLSPTLGGARAPAEAVAAAPPAPAIDGVDEEDPEPEIDELGPMIRPVAPPPPAPPPPRPAPRPAPRRPAAAPPGFAAIADLFDLTKFQARYQQAIKRCADLSLAVAAIAMGMSFFFAGGGAGLGYLLFAAVAMFFGLTVVLSGAAVGYLFVAGAWNTAAGLVGAAFRGARRPGG